MPRAAAFALCLLALAAAPGLAGPAPASGASTPAPLLLPAPIPPDLQALETRMAALRLSSVRLSMKTSLHGGGGGGVTDIAKLFDFGFSGVETISPDAAAGTFTLFGTTLRLRLVEGRVYLYFYALGRYDGGRPWIRLENGQLGKLLSPKKGTSTPVGASGAERFGQLIATINEGSDIRELGPATVDGQPVVGFSEQLEPTSKVSLGGSGPLSGFSASKRRVPRTAPEPHVTLQIYIAASGMPVRLRLRSASGPVSLTEALDFFAINFPYTIPPPPPSHVIGEGALRRLERRRRATHRAHRQK